MNSTGERRGSGAGREREERVQRRPKCKRRGYALRYLSLPATVLDDLTPVPASRRIIDNSIAVDESMESMMEAQVAKDLNEFGFQGMTREVSPFDTEDNGGQIMKIDIAFEKERVALELDGPHHFVSIVDATGDGGRGGKNIVRRNGTTKAKTRLLEGTGWQVSRLGWMIKSKLDKVSAEERKAFWVKKLGKFGVEPL